MRLNIEVPESATSLFPGFFNRFIKQIEKGNRDAARLLQERCRENVSQPYPPASQEGEFPRLRTGRGKDSIQVVKLPPEGSGQPSSYEVFVAPPYLHMAYLELGEAFAWDKVTPIVRKWLEPTYLDNEAEIEAMRLGQAGF